MDIESTVRTLLRVAYEGSAIRKPGEIRKMKSVSFGDATEASNGSTGSTNLVQDITRIKSRALLIAAEIVLRMRLDDAQMKMADTPKNGSVAEWLHDKIVRAIDKFEIIDEIFNEMEFLEDRFVCSPHMATVA